MEHWTDKYELARKAGALILASEAKHGLPHNFHTVGTRDKQPDYGCSESEYTIVWPDGVVEGLVESLKWAMSTSNMRYSQRIKGQNDAWCDAIDRANSALSPFTSEVGK